MVTNSFRERAGGMRMRHIGLALTVAVALGACVGDEVELGQLEHSLLTNNSLTRNSIVNNSLVNSSIVSNSIANNSLANNENAISIASNSLTHATLSSSAVPSDLNNPVNRLTIKNIAECALPAGRSLTFWSADGTWSETFHGSVGLAPEWETGACGESCQRWVTGCLLSRMNYHGVKTLLSLRVRNDAFDKPPALRYVPDEEYWTMSVGEGVFYGNLFAPITRDASGRIRPRAWICTLGNTEQWEVTRLRACMDLDGSSVSYETCRTRLRDAGVVFLGACWESRSSQSEIPMGARRCLGYAATNPPAPIDPRTSLDANGAVAECLAPAPDDSFDDGSTYIGSPMVTPLSGTTRFTEVFHTYLRAPYTAPHGVLQIGAALDKYSSWCASQVAAQDPYCANTSWDPWCMRRAFTICNTHNVCTSGPRNDLATGAILTEGDNECVTAVCRADPFCCGMQPNRAMIQPQGAWDAYCRAAVDSLCGATLCTTRTCSGANGSSTCPY
jgi:hypothetical protein